MDADSLYNLLLSIKGIGNTLATRILNTITEEMQ
jgi:Holliday junction resolvasome RuvABC DNA-binding subunit